MKKIITASALFLSLIVCGQDNAQNWVKKTIYTPTVADPQAKTVSVTYLDGLGRPIQQIDNAQSASSKDISTYIGYDDFGRQQKQYLPYPASTNTMIFDDDPTTSQAYVPYAGNNPYSEKEFDGSPLNRVMKMAAPGNLDTWAMGSGHEISMSYNTNIDSDLVRHFKGTGQLFTDEGYYQKYVLYKTVTTDENGQDSETYTNTKGQLILKRSNAGADLDTYYVYDEFDNLVFVISPKANGNITPAILEDLCYQYKYDQYHRLIEKRVPGKQSEYIVYDKLNRIVATGPTFSPFGSNSINGTPEQGWLLTYYDQLSRVALTGWVSVSGTFNNQTRASLQANTYDSGVTNIERSSVNIIDGASINYDNQYLPNNLVLLSVNYYDDYNFEGATNNFSSSIPSQFVYYNNTNLPIGMPTGSWVRVPDTTLLFETSYILYDQFARPISVYKKNYMDGYTHTETELDFAGRTHQILTTHRKRMSDLIIITKDAFTYTAEGRQDKHTHEIISALMPRTLMSQNNYTELGQLITKFTGNTDGQTPLQEINYQYNVRGWLTDINEIQDGNPNRVDLFAFKINYDLVGVIHGTDVDNIASLYNGNISETYWRTASDNVERRYGYEYDGNNRMVNAIYNKPGSAITTKSYNEHMKYDYNGNITMVTRNGNLDLLDTYMEIDDLTYKYRTNTNRLEMVFDSTGSTLGFRDNALSSTHDADDYDYDINGNLIIDNNKGIVNIRYNHLNLPTEVSFQNSKIYYIYNAAGQKVSKTIATSAGMQVTHYLDRFQYFNDDLKFFATSEGYVSAIKTGPTDYKFRYVFNYTDHLGNIRLSYGLNENGILKILEENHYYPYGLKHTNYNSVVLAHRKEDPTEQIVLRGPIVDPGGKVEKNYAYKFNGMEWQDELELNLYDMDMRDYDPAIGRWTGIDPVTHHSMSPYCAFDNNPVFWRDPSGADGLPPEAINSWHFAGNNSLNTFFNGGTGNLSNGDHMLGGSGDEFWEGQTAYTGGDKAWSNYFEDNSPKGQGVATAENISDGEILDEEDIAPPETIWEWISGRRNTLQKNRTKLMNCEFPEVITLLIGGAEVKAVNQSIIVLGKYPQYVNMASKLKAKIFSIPTNVWNKMTHAEQWAANTKFLDRAVARGDKFLLSNRLTSISEATGYFKMELQYLSDKGYRLAKDGLSLIKY